MVWAYQDCLNALAPVMKISEFSSEIIRRNYLCMLDSHIAESILKTKMYLTFFIKHNDIFYNSILSSLEPICNSVTLSTL
jgi:hypothetical protein